MHERLLDFLRVARANDIVVSVADGIAAYEATALVGFDDRQILKDSLRLVLAKTQAERERFDRCFDVFFYAGSSQVPADGTSLPASEAHAPSVAAATFESPLARVLLEDDRAALARDLHAAAASASVSEVRLFTQIGTFTRRILGKLGIEALDAAIARLRAAGGPSQREAAEYLSGRRGAVVSLARDIVERRLALQAPAAAQRMHDRFLMEGRFGNVDPRDRERMRTLVHAMARRLATRYGRTRTRFRRGHLDISRTVRSNLAYDGVPFRVAWKRQKIRKPRIVVLCDVSGSVAPLASFLLLFAAELSGAVADVRAFAFSDTVREVTDALASRPLDEAIAEVMRTIGFHSSDYGQVLASFERDFSRSVDRKTSVIVLGDARTNYGDPRVDVVRRLREHAKRIVWLNPEHRSSWGTDDSEMLRYLPHCNVARTCNQLRHLEDALDALLRAS